MPEFTHSGTKKNSLLVMLSVIDLNMLSITPNSTYPSFLGIMLPVNGASVSSRGQKSIVPIFFFVEPDDLKLKTRPDRDAPYKAAFEAYEKEFSNEAQAWKTALGKVDERKGWVVKEDTSQAAIVKLVVKEVLEKLKIKQKSVTKHLVGLDGQIKELTKLLDVNHDDVRLIGIYGMGGIGKTTIAVVIFNQLYSHFGKCCSFLEGIRERLTKEGIVPLQKKLLSDIGGSTSVGEINDSEEGMRRIRATLNNKKVLVVLDDVDKKVPIKNLIGNSKLCRGSRIIITTRDISVLEVEGFKDGTRKYEMLQMDVDSALQLFCRHAFSRDSPLDGYCQLSSDIVLSTGGLPLAIEVIGSLLNGKDQEIWKETLDKLREVPEKEILEKLRISYDDLENHHKQIFLDIACFFCNENKTDAIYMWTACKFYPNRGIEVLTNRCLVKILDNDQFQMHDQLIALGRQIVREDSPNDLEKQSRLWIAEEALQIMRTKEVKHKVLALELFSDGPPIEIRNEDFERLPNLRILDLKGGTFAGNFTSCSNLRWFSWHYPPFVKYMSNFNLDFRADNLYLDQLVVLKLNGIDFKDDSKAWDLIKRAQKLKVLSISSCSGITTIPDISRCLSLERLTLHHCDKLKRIESFIGDLQSLIELKIQMCTNFTDLPEEVGALVKLKRLSLSGCINLSELPSSLGNLTSLMELNLSGSKIRELPNFIGQLKSSQILHFPLSSVQFSEHHDWQLPSGISTLVNLEELDLCRHNGMKGEIPIGEQALRILNLRQTGIGRIPRTINKLHHLQTLDLTDCNEIQELPELPTSLNYLFLRSLSLHSVPNLSKLTNLVELVLSDGDPNYRKLKLFPGCDIRWIGNLSKLEWLGLNLPNVPVPPELASLSLLKEVHLTRMDLKPLALLPSSCWSLRNLSTLDIFSCVAEDISLDGLPQLESISCRCKRLKRLSIPSELRKLRDVKVLYCPELVELRVVGLSKSLKDLSFRHCKSLTKISGLQYLKNLKKLILEHCKVTDMEGLDELESLETLSVIECRSLRRLIGASRTKIPDNCYLYISECGYSIKDSEGMPLKRYREEVLLDTSKKISITIRFQLGVKKSSERFEFVGGIEREKKGVDPYLLTYEGLVADLKNFGFGLKRMWFDGSLDSPFKERIWLKGFHEIKSDEEVNRIFKHSSINGLLIHLFVEGWVHSEWEGEYDDEMMEMLREQRRMKTDVYSDEDEVKWWGFSCSDSELNFDSTSFADLVPSPMSFTIRFHLGVKKCYWGCIGGIEREKEGVDSSSVTYEGLIADVKNFGFRTKRMWYEIPLALEVRIVSDEKVNTMLEYASREISPIHLVVEGEVDSEWEGEYDDEMMKMLREQRRMKTDVCSVEDGAKGGASCPNEDSNSASVGGESETHGSSSVDDFELERGNTECFEATTSIAEKNLDTVKNQVELHEESRDKKSYQLKSTSAKQGKRQRDDDHASHTNTTAKKSTCGLQSGSPQQVTSTTRQAAKKQPLVEAAGPSRKKKKNDSKQVNPIRRSARLMKGPTGGTSDIMNLD
ncbi:hypothetical protein ACJRO7_015788 [Eucalyptus globulus]|uniref:TMV resistance protein N-like n=1 Tax=Eucalyptus globulus TaxID=34317 RepID=A0ABD3L4U6_EUCGL